MIKGKIIKITEATVYIGYEDGSLKEIPIESCDFEPSICLLYTSPSPRDS